MQKTYYIFFLLIALLQACANVSAPTGGKKDETPPAIVRTSPVEKSRNFKDQTIELVFDEFIQVDNLKQELLITPDIEGTYEFKPIKNGVRLLFDKPFLPNTTYTLNFRNAIKDVTEKNVAENVKLVFSTGEKLDTLSIEGKVTNLLTGKPAENAVVSLYRTNDTLDILKHKPFYFTKTDKNGNYVLENIRQDQYRIYALEDRNNNLKYDSQTMQNELMDFRVDPIVLDSSYHNVDFEISKMDSIPPRVTGRNAKPDFYELEFDEGLDSGLVAFNDNAIKPVFNLINNGKTLRIYNTTQVTDSIPVRITAVDSLGNALTQNLYIKFEEETSKNRTDPKRREKLEVRTDPAEGEKVLKDFTYNINFSKPIVNSTLKDIQLLADTVNTIPIDPSVDFKWNPYKTKLSLSKKVQFNQRIRFVAPKGTFISVEGDTASLIKTTHELKDPENYGTISGKITTSAPHFIVQLLNASNQEVVAAVRNQKAYQFNYLNAGEYLIRIIIDRNNNGKWDQGSFLQKTKPEEIVYMSRTLKLKENWELTDQDIQF